MEKLVVENWVGGGSLVGNGARDTLEVEAEPGVVLGAAVRKGSR
jgi:hypothetical protein